MAVFKIFRETALPTAMQPYAMYVIAPPAQPNYIEIYVTNADGSQARRVPKTADIEAIIDEKIAQKNELEIVADIAERDALSPTRKMHVYVQNASADTTVNSGGATYLYNTTNNSWIKISEAESLDVVLNWSALQGGPSSTPAQIDTTVAASHTHANKTQLDKIGESGGQMTYGGAAVTTQWSSVGW